MSDERDQKSILPCTPAENNPRLEPEGFGALQGYVRVACYACGVQYDRRELSIDAIGPCL
jgi:hypothetical protein